MNQNKHSTYYPYFDYLRITLACIVMLYHDGLISWGASGKLAVDVFFALSGWLIGNLLIKTDKDKLTKFYFNRALRIWVPYYIAFIFVVIASILKDPLDFKWFEIIIYKFTWVYNIFGPPQLSTFRELMPLDGTANHFWSVNAEEQFYILAPVLLVIFNKFGRMALTWLVLVVLLWFIDIYVPISLGVLAAILNSRRPHLLQSKWGQSILFLAFFLASYSLIFKNNYSLYAPIFSISVILLLAKKGKKSALGSLVGGMSYPLYLNHWIGVFFFNLILEPFDLRDTLTRQVLSIILNLFIAGVLYYYIERKILDCRENLFSNKRALIFTLLPYSLIILGLIFGLILTTTFNAVFFLALVILSAIIVGLTVLKTNNTLSRHLASPSENK
jgi:peptidoglycan/LPS O-acetylase OafA/YrhL